MSCKDCKCIKSCTYCKVHFRYNCDGKYLPPRAPSTGGISMVLLAKLVEKVPVRIEFGDGEYKLTMADIAIIKNEELDKAIITAAKMLKVG